MTTQRSSYIHRISWRPTTLRLSWWKPPVQAAAVDIRIVEPDGGGRWLEGVVLPPEGRYADSWMLDLADEHLPLGAVLMLRHAAFEGAAGRSGCGRVSLARYHG